ncbi:MAG: hypothetical protein Q4P66_01725 [Actinomycetaceae bacterium]|nr:hypothetical protein [Actinomycetaceae bacterium]
MPASPHYDSSADPEQDDFDIVSHANSPDADVLGIIDAPKPQIQAEAALEQSASTPWLVDLFSSISLAGVVVFNAADFSIITRIVALVALLVALALETKYSAGAQARSDRYLMMTLIGIVGGFIIIIVSSVVLLELTDTPAMPWILFAAISLLGFVVARGFRYFTRAYIEKNHTDSRG